MPMPRPTDRVQLNARWIRNVDVACDDWRVGRARAFRSKPGRPWILYGDSHRIIIFALTSLIAVLLLGSGITATVNGALIAADGGVIRGEVVAARHGSKGDFVTVRLDPPMDIEVDLVAWSGRPAVGSDLTVRYKRSDPSRAIDARLRMPWGDMKLALAGLVLALMSWGVWTGSWYGDLLVEGTRPYPRRRRVRD
jgi:hypothetical protein